MLRGNPGFAVIERHDLKSCRPQYPQIFFSFPTMASSSLVIPAVNGHVQSSYTNVHGCLISVRPKAYSCLMNRKGLWSG